MKRVQAMQYFFHVRRGNVIYEDMIGVEFPGMTEAASHARAEVAAILRDEPEVPAELQSIEIADGTGKVVHTVQFA
ncbi:MAG: hypothetical protein ABL879_10945 [Devosia sp.]